MPIIHTNLDLGSFAGTIEEHAKAIVGGAAWEMHKAVVSRYWQEIASYWERKNGSGLKIFQDGMPADGAIGEAIVKDLANKGSMNHKIIEQLLEKGAKLVQTENPELLKEEYALTSSLVQKKMSLLMRLRALFHYRRRKDALLEARDVYIAKKIDEKLEEEEIGVCFLGAYHQIIARLPDDIEVIMLKDPQKVREYYKKLTDRRATKEVEQLAHYLLIPIMAV